MVPAKYGAAGGTHGFLRAFTLGKVVRIGLAPIKKRSTA